MGLQGDLSTFSLPELLQWLDGARKSGRLVVMHGEGERAFYLQDGAVERFGARGLYERLVRRACILRITDEARSREAVGEARAGAPFLEALERHGVRAPLMRSLVREDVLQAAADLFEDVSGSFSFSENSELEGEETVAVQVSLRELLYEAAQRLDEASAGAKVIGGDEALLRPAKPADTDVSLIGQAALAALGRGSTVGAVRLALGLSRVAAARLLHDLFRGGYLTIAGAQTPRPDPLTHMLRQGERLLADGQFEAAALVFNSLLAADPGDHRVRDFARAVEREHVEALYRKLSPVAVPQLTAPANALAALRPDERNVAGMINGKWDVSTLVLASPLRELQTLRALERMVELGLVNLG